MKANNLIYGSISPNQEDDNYSSVTETRWLAKAIDPNGNEVDIDCLTERDKVEKEARRVATTWAVEVWLVQAECDIKTDQPVGDLVRHEIKDVIYWHIKD